MMEELVNAVIAKIKRDCRVKVSELCIEFPHVSHGTLFEIVKECVGYKKVCVRWVLKMLTPDHFIKKMAACLKFFVCYHKKGDDFFDQIVIGNETWVSYITPKNKE